MGIAYNVTDPMLHITAVVDVTSLLLNLVSHIASNNPYVDGLWWLYSLATSSFRFIVIMCLLVCMIVCSYLEDTGHVSCFLAFVIVLFTVVTINDMDDLMLSDHGIPNDNVSHISRTRYLAIPSSSDNLDDAYIPWDNTHSLSLGYTRLNRMYDSLPEESTLKIFLESNCTHLLGPLEGHTGIPKDYRKPSVLAQLPNTVKLTDNYVSSEYNNLPRTVGLYAFYLEGEDHVTQCGSSVRFANRMRAHYLDASKGNFIFKDIPISSYTWTPVRYSNDYVNMYLSTPTTKSMTEEEETILLSFTRQEVRSLEQAYTTFAEPTNYKNVQVNTWHNNWQKGDVSIGHEPKRITWITSDGVVHSRSSISAGIEELGFSRRYIKGLAQVKDKTLMTTKYGKVTVSVEGVEKNLDTLPDKRHNTPLNTYVDTSDMLANHYYLYDVDMNTLPYGPYPTATAANKGMGLPLNYGGTHLWTNYMHVIHAIGLGISVYIVKRFVEQSQPVIVTTLSTNTTTEYPSVRRALKDIAPYMKNDHSLLSRIIHHKPIVNRDNNRSFLMDYKQREHRRTAIARYNNSSRTRTQYLGS